MALTLASLVAARAPSRLISRPVMRLASLSPPLFSGRWRRGGVKGLRLAGFSSKAQGTPQVRVGVQDWRSGLELRVEVGG
eukprot:856091-Amorphochlora_amoeboformis.AAC.1